MLDVAIGAIVVLKPHKEEWPPTLTMDMTIEAFIPGVFTLLLFADGGPRCEW